MDDELVWKKSPHGVYTPKLGYTALSVDLLQEEPSWWWRGLWKLKAPLKSKTIHVDNTIKQSTNLGQNEETPDRRARLVSYAKGILKH
jgi:hypothetical protein